MEERMEFMRPKEIGEAMAACPTLFLPLGTIEWHGLHNVVGVDAVKAHALCVRAARKGGGLVSPPLYGGNGGLDQPHTFVMEAEDEPLSNLLRPWLEKLCSEAVRQGFRAIIMLTGHYGAGQQIIVREAAVRMSKVLDVPILGTPEYFLGLDEGYTGDHAAFFETSLMMHLYPNTVDLSQLGEEPHQGVGGRDPKKYATAQDGERIADAIIDKLASLAKQMPTWDRATREAFVEAEESLVRRQMMLKSETGNAWAAWRNIGSKAVAKYPTLLVERRFDEIQELVKGL